MANYILWGAGGFALVVAEGLNRQKSSVIALFDNDPVKKSNLQGVPLVGGNDEFHHWFSGHKKNEELRGLITVGGGSGRFRLEKQNEWLCTGIQMPRFLHPEAFVADTATVGVGSQVYGLACVSAAASIGEATIINHCAYIGHECAIGNGVHVGPGAKLNGEVEVDDFAFIGTGAVILPRLKIGNGATIGAGAVVTKSVEDGAVVMGNPARSK